MDEQQSAAQAAAYLADLRELAESELLQQAWLSAPESAWRRLGWPQLNDSGLRRRLDWYGPIERWRDPLQRVEQLQLDRLANGELSLVLIQPGRRLADGMRLHGGWAAWLAEQAALRSGGEADGALVDGLRCDVIRAADGTPCSLTFTLLPTATPRLAELVRSGAIGREAAAAVQAQISNGGNLLVVGRQLTGKSAVLAALADTAAAERSVVRLDDSAGDWPWPRGRALQQRRAAQLLQRSGLFVIADDGPALAAAALWRAVLGGITLAAAVRAGSVQRGLALIEQRCLAAEPQLRGWRPLLNSAFDGMLVLELGQPQQGRLTVERIGEVLRSAALQPGEPYTVELRSAQPAAAEPGSEGGARWN
jgi:hypothetical protein